MTCAEFSKRLSAYLDGELSGWRRWKVALHLRQCPECTQMLREFEEIDQQLMASIERNPAPEYLTVAVMRRLPSMPPGLPARNRALRWAAGLTVATVQAAGLYGAYWWGFARGQNLGIQAGSSSGLTVQRAPSGAATGPHALRNGRPAAGVNPDGTAQLIPRGLWTRTDGTPASLEDLRQSPAPVKFNKQFKNPVTVPVRSTPILTGTTP